MTSHESRVTSQELQAWGEGLGRRLTAPALVTLEGELGAGKTTLAQAICRGLGIREEVTSPTFALVNEHHAEGTTVYHIDLYRLRGPEDLTNLGWDDIVNSGQIVLVEWPERAGYRLPTDALRIRLEHIPGDDEHRRLTVV
ncbi:MAG TPA: tRNA (adenosine(37)-N6)-threonylcarbamoyltransferase complex ATPase subunit type 1 TsaE [Gemmatimonadaceae bacterium]